MSAPNRVRASRIAALGVSPILRITDAAAARRRAGQDVIVLGAGEPDFDTPDWIKDAAVAAMRAGDTKYTVLDGSARLKQAVAEKFQRENGLECTAREVSVSAGAKQVIFNAMMATLEPGDEVILAAPYWVSYADIVTIAGGVTKIVPTRAEDGFRLQPEAIAAAIGPRTRWLFLNSPSNPSGAGYDAPAMRALLEVLLKHPRVWLLSDEIYEHIVYDGFEHCSPAAIEPGLAGRALTVNGVSKAYAMTGWRIGYGVGPRELIEAMAVVQSQVTSCPSSVSQAAAVAALEGPQDFLSERRNSFRTRRDLVVAALNAIDGIECPIPQGAFYVFPSCRGMIGRVTPEGRQIATDEDFADYLLSAQNVAVVPGSVFGLGPHFRLSYATAASELEEACARIARACANLG